MWNDGETFSFSLHTGLHPHLEWKCLPGRVYKSGRIAQYNTEYNIKQHEHFKGYNAPDSKHQHENNNL